MNIKWLTIASFGPAAWNSNCQPLHTFINTHPQKRESGHTRQTEQQKPTTDPPASGLTSGHTRPETLQHAEAFGNRGRPSKGVGAGRLFK
ncbi:MAG: hypothetical protein KAU94_03360, partial [Verrucomicrobia bacterium]|nr:hypothetical protein [Verrucomicrobiota bacterium]